MQAKTAKCEQKQQKWSDEWGVGSAAMKSRNKEDAEHFQQVIDRLCEWAEIWEMAFN